MPGSELQLASRLPGWIPLFDDCSGKFNRERLADLGSQRRLFEGDHALVRWQTLLVDLDDIAVTNLLSAARQWKPEQAFLFARLIHEATNQSSFDVVNQLFSALQSSERLRGNLFGLSDKVLEVPEIGLAQLWLDNGGSKISDTNDQLATRLSKWLPLFGDSSGKQIRERLEVLGRNKGRSKRLERS